MSNHEKHDVNTHAPEIIAEQVRILYKNQPFVIASSLLISILLYFPLHTRSNSGWMLLWVGSILAISVIRIGILWSYRKTVPDTATLLKRRKYIILNAAISGLIWGSLPLISMDPRNGNVHILVICTLLAMCAGSIATLPMRTALMGFAVPIVVSISAMIVILPLHDLNYFLPLLLFYLALLYGTSGNTEGMMLESIRIRFEKESLLQELGAQKREAEQANIAKSKFLAAASHDLRQPLHALGLYLDTMTTELNTRRQEELANKMGIAVDALNDLFQSLLDISKLDAGIVEPNIHDCLISTIFKRLEVRFIPLAKMKNLEIIFDGGNQAAATDPLLLERILDNLISNAIRYTVSGKITVTAKRDNGNLLVEVADTGPGIPGHEQENIFREFYQMHNPERDRTKGLGLGLSIVRRLCNLLGHALNLESELAKGTCFRLLLPAGNPENIARTPEPVTRPGWDIRGTRILVIDDEAEIREAMQQLLANWGCTAVCVDSAEKAKAAILSGLKPHLIIADYRLRASQTGVEAIRAVTEVLQAKVPGILITGDTAPQRLQEAARSGFKLLHKPVNPGQLRMMVNHLLTKHA